MLEVSLTLPLLPCIAATSTAHESIDRGDAAHMSYLLTSKSPTVNRMPERAFIGQFAEGRGWLFRLCLVAADISEIASA